jgi:hypothetical protein
MELNNIFRIDYSFERRIQHFLIKWLTVTLLRLSQLLKEKITLLMIIFHEARILYQRYLQFCGPITPLSTT